MRRFITLLFFVLFSTQSFFSLGKRVVVQLPEGDPGYAGGMFSRASAEYKKSRLMATHVLYALKIVYPDLFAQLRDFYVAGNDHLGENEAYGHDESAGIVPLFDPAHSLLLIQLGLLDASGGMREGWRDLIINVIEGLPDDDLAGILRGTTSPSVPKTGCCLLCFRSDVNDEAIEVPEKCDQEVLNGQVSLSDQEFLDENLLRCFFCKKKPEIPYEQLTIAYVLDAFYKTCIALKIVYAQALRELFCFVRNSTLYQMSESVAQTLDRLGLYNAADRSIPAAFYEYFRAIFNEGREAFIELCIEASVEDIVDRGGIENIHKIVHGDFEVRGKPVVALNTLYPGLIKTVGGRIEMISRTKIRDVLQTLTTMRSTGWTGTVVPVLPFTNVKFLIEEAVDVTGWIAPLEF